MKQDNEESLYKGMARFFNGLGLLIIVCVIILCGITVIPQMFGYEPYRVTSGSMEPQIPVNSLIYVRQVDPEELKKDDIITYKDSIIYESNVTHRVVENDKAEEEVITKGDANKKSDLAPVKYDQIQGKVVLTLPKAGCIFIMFETLQGKIMIFMLFILGILLRKHAKMHYKAH